MKRTRHRFEVSGDGKPLIGSKDILKLRKKTLKVSQSIFAELIGVSTRAVTSWECGWRQPSASAQKLIRQLQNDPQIALDAIGEKI